MRGHVRPCEAVHERPCSLLIGSDRSHDKLCEAEAMRGRIRPLTASHVGGRGNERPNSASHGLSRERPCSLLIGSDRSHDKLCEAEAVRGRIRPLTASHGLGLSLSANQMTGNRVRECMGGRERP